MRGLIHDARFGVIETERIEVGELNGFGNLVGEGTRTVDDADAFFFEVLQRIVRVEDGVAVATLPSGRAHAIEEQGLFGRGARIVSVIARVNAEPVCAAGIELVEKRDEPALLFVENSDWLVECG